MQNLLFLVAMFLFIYGMLSLNKEWQNQITVLANQKILAEQEAEQVPLDAYATRVFGSMWNWDVLGF